MKNKKKLVILTLFTLFAVSTTMAQMIDQPIKWNGKIVHVEKNIYEVQAIGVFDADKQNWHIYDLGPYTDGPNPTSLTLTLPSSIRLNGKPYLLTKAKKMFDAMFNMEIGICEGKVIVAQRVEVSAKDSTDVVAVIEWMTCDDGTCLPPTEKEIKLKLPPAVDVTKTK
ncbi:MAG: hypothetical protein WC833_01950 [Bacteroidales bacterium]|jgi:thiol:disulfide interchange protein DsbD